MKCAASIFLLCLLFYDVRAQDDFSNVYKAKTVSADRYHDIGGSPYYFKDWVYGALLQSDGERLNKELINYNGYSHELEVRRGDKIYALDKLWYLRAEIPLEQNTADQSLFSVPLLIFQFSADQDLSNRYAAILFTGTQLTLIRDFDVRKDDSALNSPGRSGSRMQFNGKSTYFIKKSGRLVPLILQKRRIAEAFEDDPRILEYIATQKLKLNFEHDLVELVKYADTLR